MAVTFQEPDEQERAAALVAVSESLIAWALHQLGTQEMVHLLDRHHNDHFIALMNRFMPQWRLYRGYHPL